MRERKVKKKRKGKIRQAQSIFGKLKIHPTPSARIPFGLRTKHAPRNVKYIYIYIYIYIIYQYNRSIVRAFTILCTVSSLSLRSEAKNSSLKSRRTQRRRTAYVTIRLRTLAFVENLSYVVECFEQAIIPVIHKIHKNMNLHI